MDRRNFLRGLIAAPAVVVAAHIMPVRALKLVMPPPFLMLDEYAGFQIITRESIEMFINTNHFLGGLERQYSSNQTLLYGPS